MATAYIDWSDDNCDWGVTQLGQFDYSCPNSEDGLHGWAFERAICVSCDGQEVYCLDCGAPGCECGGAVE
jgi:hypothetical protein